MVLRGAAYIYATNRGDNRQGSTKRTPESSTLVKSKSLLINRIIINYLFKFKHFSQIYVLLYK